MGRPPHDWPSDLHALMTQRPDLAGIGYADVAEMVTGG